MLIVRILGPQFAEVKCEMEDQTSSDPFEESCISLKSLEFIVKAEEIEIGNFEILADNSVENSKKRIKKNLPNAVPWEPKPKRTFKAKTVKSIDVKSSKSKSKFKKDSKNTSFLKQYGKLLEEEDDLFLTKRQ